MIKHTEIGVTSLWNHHLSLGDSLYKCFREVSFIAPIIIKAVSITYFESLKVVYKLQLHSPDEVLHLFCRLQRIASLIVIKKDFLFTLLLCCIYLCFE